MPELSVPPVAERWPWPPALRLSAWVHAGALALGLWQPGAWPWALGAVLLNHAGVVFLGLWPRSTGLGPNVRRLPGGAADRGEVAITIDDGPDPQVTPAVLDQLAAAGAVATFFCIGDVAERHPELVREIVARGHSVQNHSHRHDHRFSLSGPAAFARELRAAQAALSAASGVVPTCFRAPAGLRNPFLAPVLQRLGLHLVSWTRRGFDTRESDPARVLARLTDGLQGGDILLLHDRHAARMADGRPVVLEVLPRLLDRCRALGLKTITLPQALAPATAWTRLQDLASRRYQAAGPFAWRFARGKLGMDPVFRSLVQGGLIVPGAHVLDIGCGQGLLASLLKAVDESIGPQDWPPSWGPPPLGCRVTGIDLSAKEIERARLALGSGVPLATEAGSVHFVCGDLRSWAFPAGDVVVILDVLHYMAQSDQDDVLARACRALRPGGRLVLRVADGASRAGFRFGQGVDWLVARLRGYKVSPFHGRSLAEWRRVLEAQGLSVQVRPMSQGTPFANVLLVASMTHGDAAVPAPPPDKELNR